MFSLLSSDDLFLFNQGTHYRLYEKLGAHVVEVADGAAARGPGSPRASGTYFAVWAPNARKVSVVGDFKYDAGNQVGQSTYNLADFRAGWRAKRWFAEGWIKNAFDTHYVPVALYYGTTPSGYVGESGAPATFGLRAGLSF